MPGQDVVGRRRRSRWRSVDGVEACRARSGARAPRAGTKPGGGAGRRTRRPGSRDACVRSRIRPDSCGIEWKRRRQVPPLATRSRMADGTIAAGRSPRAGIVASRETLVLEIGGRAPWPGRRPWRLPVNRCRSGRVCCPRQPELDRREAHPKALPPPSAELRAVPDGSHQLRCRPLLSRPSDAFAHVTPHVRLHERLERERCTQVPGGLNLARW